MCAIKNKTATEELALVRKDFLKNHHGRTRELYILKTKLKEASQEMPKLFSEMSKLFLLFFTKSSQFWDGQDFLSASTI